MEKKIKELYERYIKETGKKPLFAGCQIAWNDTDETLWVNIKLNNEEEPRLKDEKIFYYATGIDELVHLSKRQKGEDFRIVGFDNFSDDI